MGIEKFCPGCYDILMASATLAIAGGTQQGSQNRVGAQIEQVVNFIAFFFGFLLPINLILCDLILLQVRLTFFKEN